MPTHRGGGNISDGPALPKDPKTNPEGIKCGGAGVGLATSKTPQLKDSWVRHGYNCNNGTTDNCGKSAAILVRETGPHYMFWGIPTIAVRRAPMQPTPPPTRRRTPPLCCWKQTPKRWSVFLVCVGRTNAASLRRALQQVVDSEMAADESIGIVRRCRYRTTC